jgi:hypothetical protein
MKIFSTSYDSHYETNCGQHTQQIKTTKFDFWNNSIIYWNFYLKINIPLKSQLTKNGQRTNVT